MKERNNKGKTFILKVTGEELYVIERAFDIYHTEMLNKCLAIDNRKLEANFLEKKNPDRKDLLERNTYFEKQAFEAYCLYKGISDKCVRLRTK